MNRIRPRSKKEKSRLAKKERFEDELKKRLDRDLFSDFMDDVPEEHKEFYQRQLDTNFGCNYEPDDLVTTICGVVRKFEPSSSLAQVTFSCENFPDCDDEIFITDQLSIAINDEDYASPPIFGGFCIQCGLESYHCNCEPCDPPIPSGIEDEINIVYSKETYEEVEHDVVVLLDDNVVYDFGKIQVEDLHLLVSFSEVKPSTVVAEDLVSVRQNCDVKVNQDYSLETPADDRNKEKHNYSLETPAVDENVPTDKESLDENIIKKERNSESKIFVKGSDHYSVLFKKKRIKEISTFDREDIGIVLSVLDCKTVFRIIDAYPRLALSISAYYCNRQDIHVCFDEIINKLSKLTVLDYLKIGILWKKKVKWKINSNVFDWNPPSF